MTTATIKGFIHKNKFTTDFTFFTSDMTSFGYAMVGPYEFEFTVPDSFNASEAEIAALTKEKQTVQTDAATRVTNIEAQIEKLQHPSTTESTQ